MVLRQATTESGVVRGLVGHDPRITVYRGVPYAKPPVGELRWRAPQPAEPWTGVRNCYEYGPMAMMRVKPGSGEDFYTKELHPVASGYEMSEDCLYLNIFTPAESVDEKLPVLCYIHGGGLQDGYSYEIEFDGERLARRGIVVVMIGYRLGLFGFLAHPDLTAETPQGAIVSNFGMQDQSAAIHWVARNIRQFGGDPEKITICGQSAGASSVLAQICSPVNDGLIKGAICQSGGTLSFDEEGVASRYPTLAEAEQYGKEFLEDIGLHSIAEARQIDADEMMHRLRHATPKETGLFAIHFGIVLEGHFLAESPAASLYSGRVPALPMMVGHCQDETKMPLFGWREPPTLAEFEQIADKYGDRKADFLRAANAKSDADVAKLYESGVFDGFPAGCRGMCTLRADAGQRTYYYVFDHDIPGGDGAGSFHGSDLWFMFDSLENSWRPFEGRHFDLARQVCSYWINFIKHGDPNGADYNGNPLPAWKPYRREEQAYMRFMDKPTPLCLAQSPVLDFRLEYAREKLARP